MLEAKLAPARARDGSVSRPGLVNRLRAAATLPLVTIDAPVGYGKSTLLAQWAERDARPFAWVTLDAGDDDPVALLSVVAEALGRLGPLDPRPDRVLRRGEWKAALARVCAAVAARPEPFVLVLDDVHALPAGRPAEVVAELARHIPAGATLVLAGRSLPALPIARLRAEGRLVELGRADLEFARREAGFLFRAAGVALEDADEAALCDRAEGWPAGLYLAALAVLTGASPQDFRGGDRFVRDYVRLEVLAGASAAERRFLLHASALDRLSGPLCDAALRTRGSAAMLAELEDRNLFVLPLDRSREEYRLHRLVREALRAELASREPDRATGIARRAAAWCEANGRPEEAIAYATGAGDADRRARLVAAVALPALHEGRIRDAERWLEDRDGDPELAAVAAWVHALRGRPEEAEAELAAAGRIPAGLAVRATLAVGGVDGMRADATAAGRGLEPCSLWRPQTLVVRGVAAFLLGDLAAAEADLQEGAESAERLAAADARMVALAELALLRADEDRHEESLALARQARELVDADRAASFATAGIALAAAARAELRAGNADRARADLAAAGPAIPLFTHAIPWLSAQALLELARTHVALLEVDEARPLLTRARGILRRRPGLGSLPAAAAALGRELNALGSGPAAPDSTLTPAELRLVPLLATHMSFREIGEHLHVSRNTVKTQAIAVYRKLGVSSRSDAIGRAAELGLVRPALPSGSGVIPAG